MTSPSYPAGLDALAHPGPTTETDDAGFELDIVITRLQNCVAALEAKLGIGASAAVAGQVLRGTGAGATAFGTLQASDVTLGQLPVLIASTVVSGSPAATVDINPISGAFSSLQVRIYGRATGAVANTAVLLVFNNDASNSYFAQSIQVSGAGVVAAEGTTLTFINIGTVPGASASAAFFGTVTTEINAYARTGNFKPVSSVSYFDQTTGATARQLMVAGGTWTSAAAITSLKVTPLSGSWAVGTAVAVYGVP